MWVWPQNPFERCLPPLLVFPEQPKEAMGTVIQVKKLLFFCWQPQLKANQPTSMGNGNISLPKALSCTFLKLPQGMSHHPEFGTWW